MIDYPAVLRATWVSVNKRTPAREAYDRLAAANGEGPLVHGLAQMAATPGSPTAKADAMRRDENEAMLAKLAEIKLVSTGGKRRPSRTRARSTAPTDFPPASWRKMTARSPMSRPTSRTRAA